MGVTHGLSSCLIRRLKVTNKKNITVTAFLFLLITACATPADLRKQTPDAIFKSAKNAKVVSVCIGDKWAESNLGAYLRVRPTAFGYSLTVTYEQSGQTLLIADVLEQPDGKSETRYVENGIGLEAKRSDVGTCQ